MSNPSRRITQQELDAEWSHFIQSPFTLRITCSTCKGLSTTICECAYKRFIESHKNKMVPLSSWSAPPVQDEPFWVTKIMAENKKRFDAIEDKLDEIKDWMERQEDVPDTPRKGGSDRDDPLSGRE